jgi:hypothetical protein
MHGVGRQAPGTEGRSEYKTEAAEEVIGGQEQETPDDRDIIFFYSFFFGNRTGFESQRSQADAQETVWSNFDPERGLIRPGQSKSSEIKQRASEIRPGRTYSGRPMADSVDSWGNRRVAGRGAGDQIPEMLGAGTRC